MIHAWRKRKIYINIDGDDTTYIKVKKRRISSYYIPYENPNEIIDFTHEDDPPVFEFVKRPFILPIRKSQI